jgi:hypothetical protein
VGAPDARLGRKRVVRGELDPLEAEPTRDDLEPGALEDPQLGLAVGLERLVAVEVVRLEVEQHGHLTRELVHVLELEARQLADDQRALLELSVQLGQRPADVAGDGRAGDCAQQLGGGRLPVRSGDAHEARPQQPVAELDLAPDRELAALGLSHQRRLARHARALHEQLDAVQQGELAVVAELAVGAHDLHSAPLERGRGRLPRAREPEN